MKTKNQNTIKILLFGTLILGMGGFLLLSKPVLAAAGINKQINFQGKVVNTDGTNVSTASYTFLFCLYTTASPTTACTSGADNDAVWRESKSLTVTDGIFQTNLGDTTALPGSVDFNTDNIYLGINFNANGQMTPLVRFTAAPYAMNADKVGGLGTSDLIVKAATANQTVTSTQTSGTVFGITDTTAISAATKGLSITLSGSGAFDQTGLEFNLSGASGTNLNDIVGSGSTWKVSKGGAATFSSIVSSGALAANGGITFDQSTDTIGSFTSNGTILMNTNILQDIGNTGTDFIASTGALTLAGVLTANGGISLSGSQSLSAAALSYVDLGLITHSTTANQGLRLPNAASATPSNPTSGEGYLAWDAAGNQLITYNGAAWTTLSGGGYNLIKDETSGLTARTTLAFLGAGVSCADNVTQTECTIAGGAGGENLQTTYGLDADGSNATISLTAPDDSLVFTNPTSAGTDSAFLLQLTQQNTTAAVTVLDMTQSSNAANGVNLTANSIDGETGLAITTNGLTSGKGISVTSSATSNAFTGNLADISLTGSNASNTGNVLAVSNTGTNNANKTLFIDHRATGSGNLALRIDDQSSDTTPLIVDGDGRLGIGTSTITGTKERLLQVGSATNRGNSATYGEVVTKGFKQIQALTNIKDVFVYDTSTDSDGGRWIDWATTEKLSWYTETLDDSASTACNISTMDRCYSDAFPRKAILVVTTDSLYIFDATNGNMWMKFSQNAAGWALGADTSNDPSSVTALNGVIYVGTNGASAGGLYVFDFMADRMWNIDGTDRSGADLGIGSRNSAITYNSDNNTNFDIATTGTLADWGKINDVSVASIFGSAPTVVSATVGAAGTMAAAGTTIVALATDSGITTINLSAQKVLQYSDATDNDYNAVAITRRGRLYALNEALGQAEEWRGIDIDQVSEVNGTPDKVWDETTMPALSKSAPTVIAGAPDAIEVVERGSLADQSSDLIYFGTNQGLTEIHDCFPFNTTNAVTTGNCGWSKFINTTRQTALMPGTIQGMFMMDDASGNVTDASIRTHVLAAKGTPTYGAEGVRGKAMSYNGTSQYLCSDATGPDGTCDVDAGFNMGATAWTMTGWFKHSTTQAGTDVLFGKCYNTTPAAAAACATIYMTSTGTMVAAIDDDVTWTAYSSYDYTATTTQTYNDNQWHFFALTRLNALGIVFSIDGKGIVLAGSAATLTLDASQIVSFGADCSVGAACATGANFWDGQIDDISYSAGGATRTDQLDSSDTNRVWMRQVSLYNDARPLLTRRVITVTDATTVSSTTIGDSGETWIPNEFSGQIVTLTGGTGSGQTRRIVSNTATVLTVSPAFTTTPDTTTDFKMDPEALYGASNSVTAIGASKQSLLGESRILCAGTNSGSDTGGITCFNHQAGPGVVADMYHADAKQLDDSGAEWTGTNYDNVQSIDLTNRTMVFGTQAHTWMETQDVRLGQGMDYLQGKLFDVRGALLSLIPTVQTVGNGSQTMSGIEPGLTGGADLAENYYSDTPLEAGMVVAMDKKQATYVNQTSVAYQKDVLGVVATSPGIVLGDPNTNGYPIALVGRVPVKVTNENGPIYAGDRLTSSSLSGYAMRATQAGRVLGETLSDASDWVVCEGENSENINAKLCTTVLVFVNLTDYSGMPVELAMSQTNPSDGVDQAVSTGLDSISSEGALTGAGATVSLASATQTHEEKILAFLKTVRDAQNVKTSSEIFTGRLAASNEVITPTLFADQIFAKNIKADSIEGLQIFTDQLNSLQEKYAGLNSVTTRDSSPVAPEIAKEQLAIAMKKLSVDSIVVQLDGSILGKLSVAGALRIGGDAEFAGNTIFAKLATFVSETIFKGKVMFEKAPMFSSDTAGFAIIKKGEKEVRVSFENAYEKQPIVTVSLTNDISPLLDDKADDSLKADVAAVEKDYIDTVFASDMKYIVTEKGKDGFAIVLNGKAPADIQFSWMALAVKNPQTFESESQSKNKEETTREDVVNTEKSAPLQIETTPSADTQAVETPSATTPSTETPVYSGSGEVAPPTTEAVTTAPTISEVQ